ncbi:hypothetical protein D3C72_2229220 [compost metagenome]
MRLARAGSDRLLEGAPEVPTLSPPHDAQGVVDLRADDGEVRRREGVVRTAEVRQAAGDLQLGLAVDGEEAAHGRLFHPENLLKMGLEQA